MKTLVIEKPKSCETITKEETEAKSEQLCLSHETKKIRRLRPKYWDGEFDGLWCDEEFY